MEGNGLSTGSNFSRRSFLTHASQWSALIAAYPLFPVSDLAGSLARDSRVAQTPVVDKGFASVRKVGDGLYATISDTSKGLQTMCNGGTPSRSSMSACSSSFGMSRERPL